MLSVLIPAAGMVVGTSAGIEFRNIEPDIGIKPMDQDFPPSL